MGRYVVKVPDIGEGMTEAEIVAWHVAPGQVIREEDPLVDVMTDKATVELPAPIAGTVVAIHGQPGDKRPVGSELVVLDVAGEGNVPAAGSRNRTSTPISRPEPAPLCERPYSPAATASRKCRSLDCGGQSPSICSNRNGTSRISPISRRWTLRRWRNCAGS